MNDRINLVCIMVLGLLAGVCILAGAQVEASGKPAPSWIVGVALGAVGAISGYLGRGLSETRGK